VCAISRHVKRGTNVPKMLFTLQLIRGTIFSHKGTKSCLAVKPHPDLPGEFLRTPPAEGSGSVIV